MSHQKQKATFAAGCFWGVEAAFRKINGVLSTSVGYTGGPFKKPTYKDVCTGSTGHAEAVEILFDPSIVTYKNLVDFFWKIHDPTTLNRQGPDVGTQYRSAMYFHSPEQESIAQSSKEALQNSGEFKETVVTEITSSSEYFRAEEYHQQYLEKRNLKNCH